MKIEDQDTKQVAVEANSVGQVVPLVTTAAPRVSRRGWLSRLLVNRKALAGGLILLFFALVAIFAPIIAPGDPVEFVGRRHQPPSAEHILGTTGQGQDVFTQTVWGTRVSLTIGVLVGLLATAVGMTVGLTAAYFGGRVDDLLTLLMNIFLILPGLPLLVALAAFLPPGPTTIVAVLSFTGWAATARVLRAQALSIREKDFVSAALVSGESSLRIMFSEIVPNMASIVIGSLLGSIIYGIGAQAGLEFLGLGDVSTISWGTILYWAGNNAGLLSGAWWTFVPAGACIALAAFALAMLNYAMDEITNPRLRTDKEIVDVLRKTSGGARGATPVVKR